MHDTESNTAVAFVGLNNPHVTSAPADSLCPDRCSEVTWVSASFNPDLDKGVMICCDVEAFRAAVPYAPDLSGAALMTAVP